MNLGEKDLPKDLLKVMYLPDLQILVLPVSRGKNHCLLTRPLSPWAPYLGARLDRYLELPNPIQIIPFMVPRFPHM